jgi:hypothetical protein
LSTYQELYIYLHMETAGEELSMLEAEDTSLNQLLINKDPMLGSAVAPNTAVAYLAGYDEMLMSEAEQVQRLLSLAATAASAAAFSNVALEAQLSAKRQRLHNSSSSSSGGSPFEKDDTLQYVFSLVGGGDHLYTGAVSRRWREKYTQYCARSTTAELDDKLVTRQRSVLMTKSRLQLALKSGLSVAGWTFDRWSQAELICMQSLEPQEVMTLLIEHGVLWSTVLCDAAAYHNKLALLQWLHAQACPLDERSVLREASAGGTVAMLEWLLTVTAPWSPAVKVDMLQAAACDNCLSVMRWVRAHGAG